MNESRLLWKFRPMD